MPTWMASSRRTAEPRWKPAREPSRGHDPRQWRGIRSPIAIRTRYWRGRDPNRVPARLSLRQIERAGRSWRGMAAAVAIAAFLIGGFAGWMARTIAAPSRPVAMLTTDAFDAYKLYVVEVRHPVEVPGSEEAHLVQWLSKRVGYELHIPNLAPVGLKLVGGPAAAGAERRRRTAVLHVRKRVGRALHALQHAQPRTRLGAALQRGGTGRHALLVRTRYRLCGERLRSDPATACTRSPKRSTQARSSSRR